MEQKPQSKKKSKKKKKNNIIWIDVNHRRDNLFNKHPITIRVMQPNQKKNKKKTIKEKKHKINNKTKKMQKKTTKRRKTKKNQPARQWFIST